MAIVGGFEYQEIAVQYSAFLIAGPTASGKSAMALDLARRTGGVVINADSMQVYRELRILTARPTDTDEAAVPHRLYGHVPAVSRYSVGRWLAELGAVLKDIRPAGRPAILVGGTGLYFKAATEGLVELPEIPAEIDEKWRFDLAESGPEALHRLLAERDPATAARLPTTDRQRIIRALAVHEATGRTLSDWQAEPLSPPVIDKATARKLVLAPDRAVLRQRIDTRLREMVLSGAMEEAVRLLDSGIDPELPAAKAIGVRELAAAARGEISLDAAITRAVTETRRYAKRQETWFRNQMADWERHEPGASPPLEKGACDPQNGAESGQ